MRGIKPALTALVILIVFLLAFMAFLVAPLLLVAVVAGAMWGYERWRNGRRRPGVRSLSVPRSFVREAGSRRDPEAEEGFGFGSGLGREL